MYGMEIKFYLFNLNPEMIEKTFKKEPKSESCQFITIMKTAMKHFIVIQFGR